MRLYKDIEIKRIDENTNIVHNPKNNQYIKMGNKEAAFLESFNINKNQEPSETDDFMSIETKKLMTEKFKEMRLIGEADSDIKEKKGIKEGLKNFDISKIKLISFDPDKLLNKLSPITNKLFTPISGIFFGILFFISISILIADSKKVEVILGGIKNLTIFDGVLLYIMTILGLVLHEFSHGFACKRFGGRVNKMGIMLFYLQPAAYCDVSGVYLLDKKYKKIITFISGVMSQWAVSSIIIILYFILSPLGYNMDVFLYYALLNFCISLINIIPFVKLDGYWILSTLLNVYNLRENAFEYLLAILMGKGRYILAKQKYIHVIIYGILSILFTALLWFQVLFGLIVLIKPLINSILYILTVITITLAILYHLSKPMMKSIKNIKQKYVI